MMAPFGTLFTTTKFHHARVTKILAAANLNGLEIHIDQDFRYGVDNQSAEYKAKFPHGKIPGFETPSGFCIAEASAIAHYVCDSGPRREQLLGRTAEQRALVQMWVSFAESELFANAEPVMTVATKKHKMLRTFVEEKETQFVRALGVLERQLAQEGSVWLVRSDELSLADLTVASALFWPLSIFMDTAFRSGYPKIVEWLDRLMAVEGVGEGFRAPLTLCEKRPELSENDYLNATK